MCDHHDDLNDDESLRDEWDDYDDFADLPEDFITNFPHAQRDLYQRAIDAAGMGDKLTIGDALPDHRGNDLTGQCFALWRTDSPRDLSAFWRVFDALQNENA